MDLLGSEGRKGGTRGGRDQFSWEDVKVDKHRENYLGHSIRASVGRWQQGRDLLWYTKEAEGEGDEKGKVQAMERRMMASAVRAAGKTPLSAVVKEVRLERDAGVIDEEGEERRRRKEERRRIREERATRRAEREEAKKRKAPDGEGGGISVDKIARKSGEVRGERR